MKILRRKWVWLPVLLGVVLLVVFLTVHGKKTGPSRSERPLIHAELIKLRSEEIPVYREVTGTVASASAATLASKVLGQVEEIRVKEGNRVKTGDVLITLDSRALLAQRERAEAELENAKIHYQRIKTLFKERSATQQELDNAERTYKVAEATWKSIEADLAYTTIKAPFDGVITEKLIEVGELASPGRSLLRIEDEGHLRLEVPVAETDAAGLRIGQTVVVRLDALDGLALDGRVAQILPAADPSTHSFWVKADLPSVPRIRSGLFGRMVFPIGRRSALMIPQAAVQVEGELSRVYVADESAIVQSRLIRPGPVREGRVEVLSGLVDGERILARASDGREGAIVRIPEGSRP
ncbi:MAG TPA: efflux RND transporter periplasmic adaptor subunit [Nitrospiria bacterium]|jgi:RND family efflux transporter MFP subunit|nr:efflux RND transporter periplasmic adaptor subunit [Nitrospiria bacterium]